MEFKNLRRNILAHLGREYRRTGSQGPYPLDSIREAYSDIPHSDLNQHIRSLSTEKYIELSEDGASARLTDKGLGRLKTIQTDPEGGDITFVRELDSEQSRR